jgi:hypothetical protein
VGPRGFWCEPAPWLHSGWGIVAGGKAERGRRPKGETEVGSDARLPRYLGVAFIAQFATSLTAGILSGSTLTGSISDVLVKVAANLTQMRVSTLLELLTSVGIVALTSLLYVILREENPAVSVVAFGLWLAEAAMLAVSTLGLYALVTLGPEFAAFGAADASSYRALGTLFLGVDQHAGDIDMLFFCLGAILWYSLLLRSRIVPCALALWGLLAVLLVLVGTLILVWDRSPSIALYVPYVPFELVVGVWLLGRGAPPPALPHEAHP